MRQTTKLNQQGLENLVISLYNVLGDLLTAPDLNLDELDEYTLAAVSDCNRVLETIPDELRVSLCDGDPRWNRVTKQELKVGVVYEVEFRCTTPGPDVEEGSFTGYWTGDIDTWGKRTFKPIDGPELYLFDRELVSVEVQS